MSAALAVIAHGVAEGADNQGQGLDEAQHAAAGHGAGADVTQVVAPQGGDTVLGDQLADGHVGDGEHDGVAAEQGHQRQDHEPAQYAAGKQVRGYLHTADVAHAGQSRQHVNADAGALVARHVIGDLTGEYLQSVGNELVQGGNTQAGEYGGGLGAALLTGDQHLGAGLSLGVGQHDVFLDDHGAAQGDHHEHAQNTAAQGDQTDFHQRGHAAKALVGPHEQGRQGENGAGGHRFTGGADGLDHVVFQNGVAPQDLADDAHGDDRRRNGGGHRHAHPETQIGVGPAEDNGQNGAQNNGHRRKFGHDLVRRDIGAKLFFFHDIVPFSAFAIGCRTGRTHETETGLFRLR